MRATAVLDVLPEAKPEREPVPEPLPRIRRLLVVCAHPFDATVTLGGVIAAFADTGTAVQVVCMTHDPGPDPDGRRRPVRAAQLLRAARLLGAREATLLEHRAAHLQWNPPEVLATELRSVAGPVDAVLTIDAGAPGSHPDLVRAARAACRVASRLGCPLYAWVPRTWDTDQPPEGVITVTCDRARQRAAIGCHDSPGARDPAQGPCAEPLADAADAATSDEPQDYLTIR